MTNVLRDIGEDARRDPIYIQLDRMRRFGYSEAELMVGVVGVWFPLKLNLAVHHHQFKKFQAAHYFNAITPAILIPLAQPEQ